MTGLLVQTKLRLVLDEHQTVLSVDDGIEPLLGFSAADFTSARVSLRDRIHRDDADIAGMLFSLPTEDCSGTFNIRLRHADGRIRCVRGEYSKQAARDGGDAELDLLLQDAKSLHANGTEPASLTALEPMMMIASEALYFKNRNHVFTAGNPQAVLAFSDSSEAGIGLVGNTGYDLFPEEYADIYHRLEKRVFAGSPGASEEQPLPGKNGMKRGIESRNHAVRDTEGKVIGLFGVALDNTEHMKAKEALEAAEQEYRQIFEGALEGIFRTGMDGSVLMVNPAGARMLGYDSPQDVLAGVKNVGRDIWVDKIERARYQRKIRESEAHSVLGFECEFRCEDGSALWVSLNGRLLYGEDGEQQFNEGFFVEIAERKRAEAALRESEEALKDSQRIAGLGSYVGDLASGDWTSSDLMDQMFGIDKDYRRTVEGWAARIHPDDRAMMMNFMQEDVLGQKRAIDKEYRIVRQSDGAVRWIHDLGRLEFDGHGRPVKMHGTVRDITERKLAEQALRESEESLKESQRIAGLGTYVTDIQAKNWTRSEVLDNLLGIDVEYSGTLEAWSALVHPDDREAMFSYFVDEVVGQKKPFDREYRIVRHTDGAVRWVHGLGRLEFDEEGLPAKMIGTIQDITASKRAEQALRESEESLKESQRIAGLGSYVTDIDEGTWISSEVLDQLFGIDKDYTRTVDSWSTLVHPDDREGMVNYFVDEVVGKRKPFDREYRIVRHDDGAVRWVHGLGRLEVDAEGRPVKMIGTIQDITESKEADAALRESEESLRDAQRIAGIGSFVTDIKTGCSKAV